MAYNVACGLWMGRRRGQGSTGWLVAKVSQLLLSAQLDLDATEIQIVPAPCNEFRQQVKPMSLRKESQWQN